MIKNILLNNKTYSINEKDLPCFIVYRENEGGSQFSIALIADLFLRGSKILFLTAHPFAKDNFLEQIREMKSKTVYVENSNDLRNAQNFQAIILRSGDGELFRKAMRTLIDIKERIVFIKNMEVFNRDVIESVLKRDKIILSGNIDRSSSKKQIAEKLYKTIIAFSKPDASIPIAVPELDEYSGYLWSKDKEGVVAVDIRRRLTAKNNNLK